MERDEIGSGVAEQLREIEKLAGVSGQARELRRAQRQDDVSISALIRIAPTVTDSQ